MEDHLATDSRGPCRPHAGRAFGLLAAAAALAVATSVPAADVGVIGNQLQLKDTPTKKKIGLKSKDVAIVAPTGDPTASGATLDVSVVSTSGTQTESFTLPAAGWKASGSPVKQFKYKGEKGTPIKSVTLAFGKQIKATGEPAILSLSGAPTISAKVILGIGSTDRYCIDFTTPPNPNTIQQAKWKEQTTPGVCPGPPTTTTTATTSTTTPTAPDITCGNGIQGPGEACDDGNTVDCDGCDSNCTLSETCGNGIVCAPEQCDGGPGCNGTCETTGTTCGPASEQRLVIVSISTPEPLAGVQVVLDYPQFQTSLPGTGNSSEVRSRLFLFPSQGVNIVNDNDTELNTVFANTTNFITSGPLFAANFDECTPLTSSICARNPTVVDCCNNPADPGQFGNR